MNKFFMGLISIVLCFSIIGASTMTAFAATPVEEANDTAPKLQFMGVDSVASDELCLIVFEDMEQNGADSEGRAIIGGDLTITGSWSASVKQPYPSEYALMVGGNILEGGINAGGCVAIGGGAYSEANISVSGYCSHGGGDAVHVDNSGWIADYIGKAEQAFTAASAQYAALPADGTAFKGGWEQQWNIIANPDHVAGQPHVFNIDLDSTWGKSLSEIHFYGDFGNDAIIINVNGGTVNFTGGGGVMIKGASTIWDSASGQNVSAPACTNTMDQLKSQIIWNCYEAETIKISAYAIQGSLLAPYATATGDNGHVNGTTVVRSMIGAGGFEYHTGHFFKNPFSAALEVTKVVEGTPDAAAETEFSFQLLKSDGTLVKEFTLKNGETFRFSDFEENVTYKVVELASSEYYTFDRAEATGGYDSISGKTVTFTATDGSSRDITFYNDAVETEKEGSITVVKNLDDAVDPNAEFVFKLEYYDNGWQEISAVKLSDGKSYTFSGLKLGSYRVTETVDSGMYTTTVECTADSGAVVASSKELTLSDALLDQTVTFNNTRNYGSINVSKNVNGTDAQDSFTFRLYKYENGNWVSAGVNDITVTAGSSASFNGLPYGVTYAVAELSSDDYSFASVVGGTNESLTIDGYPAVKVTVGSNANVTFTNTLKTANLTVSKTVVGSGDAQDTFSFTLQKQNGSSWTTVETFTLKAGEVKSFTGLTANTVYRVYESSLDDIYERGAITGADSIEEDIYAIVALNADENRTVAFTNEVKPGSITVSKIVDDGYDNAESSFTFTLYESADNGTNWNAVETFSLAAGENKTFGGLDTEKLYKVVEATYANYETTVKVGSAAVNGSDTGAFEIYPNADTSVVYTNNRKTADLTVKKTINGTPFSANDSFTFRLYKQNGTRWVSAGVDDITVKANGTAKFENLAYGVTYAVAELSNPEYTFTSVTGGTAATINSMNGAYLTVDGAETLTFTNTPIPKLGGFTVTKTVSGYGIASHEFTFKVERHAVNRWVEVETFTLKAGESKTFSDLKAGDTYRITETSIPDSYKLVSITGADSAEDNVATVTIADKACPGIVFTNEVKKGSINVTKTLNDKHDNAASSFSFTAYESADGKTWTALETFTLAGGETKTIKNLDVTKQYKVVEADYSATYTTTVKVGSTETAALDSGSFTLTADKATDVTFTNVRKTASLTVKKALDGEAYEGDTFTFRLYKLVDGKYVAAGVDDVTVKPNGSAVFENLAYGNTYAVVELEAEEYTLISVTGANVTVDGLSGSKFVINGDAEVTFTNRPIPRLGGFTVTKQLTGGNAADEFGFTVQKKNGSKWEDYDSFTLRAGDSKIYTDLVEGETYRIYESETGAIYELASITGADTVEGERYAVVNVVEDGNPTVAFVNKVKQGTITVTKTLTDEALSGTSTFKFELQKLNGSTYEKVEVKELTVGHGKSASVTFENLPYNETYRVVEQGAENYDTVTVFEGAATEGKTSAGIALDGDETVEFKNTKKVILSVKKAIADGDTDLGKTFTFVIQRKVGSNWTTVETVTLMASDEAAEFEVETGTYRVLEISGTEGYTYAETTVSSGAANVTETTAEIDGAEAKGAQFLLSDNTSAVITNRTVKGNIILSKIVSDTVTPEREFTFTLQQLTDGAWADVLKADGAPVTVVLKHGEAVELNQVATLEYGSVYRVVETADKAIYETTVVTNGEHSTGLASGSITIGSQAANVAFTNTRRNAQLKIVKALTAESNDLGESFEISVYKYAEDGGWTLLTAAEDGVDGTFTIKAGANNAKYISLPVGATYKIVETATGKSYNFDSFSDNIGANDTITLMSDAEVIVYNAIKTGKLIISKTLDDEITPDAVFTFNVTDADGKVVASGSIANGESFTVENLPYGETYTVTEVVNNEVYETTVTVDGKTETATAAVVSIDSAEAAVEFENTRREGKVVIQKLLSAGSNKFDEEFSFTLYRLGDEGWVELESFDLGFDETHEISLQIGAQYGIVETATGASYEFDTTVEGTTYGQIVIGDVNNTGVLFTLGTEGQNVSVYNKNKTAKISVNKAVTGGEINDDEFTFTLQQKIGTSYVNVSTVTIKGGESAYFAENPKYPFYLGNEYRITEGDLGTRYELAEIVGADSTDGLSADFVLSADRDITFVNSVKKGSLSIRKILNDKYDAEAKFTIIAKNAETGESLASGTIGGGETMTVENIPYGTKVEVTEIYNGAVYTSTVSGLDENNVIEIGKANEVVTFTNTRKTADLSVTKALSDGGEDLGKTFALKLEMLKNGEWTEIESFTLKANEVKNFAGLFAGVTYRVVETDTTESFAYSSWTDGTATYMEPDIQGATFEIFEDKDVTIYNTLKTAKLTIGKTVAVGGEWEKGESFTFVIEKFENGKWNEFETVTLTYENRTWSSEELAVGEKYRVTETNIGYRYELEKIDGADTVDLTAKSAEVVIDENGNSLLFTNKVKLGTVIVKKTLADTLDEDAKFSFVAVNGETGETIATFELGNGESYEIADLPYGTEVEIRELGAENYTTTVDGVSAKDAQLNVEAATKTVEFKNDRKTASLTVTKALALGSNDLGESFGFELQVNDGGKWTKVSEFSIKAGEKKTISGLFVGASYRVIETKTGASYNYVGMSAGNPISDANGVEFVLEGATSITATNVSRSASLTIAKVVKGNAYNDTFTFNVEKKDGDSWTTVKTVTLGGNNGMSYTFANLTVGDVYRVTETNVASRYSITKIEGADSSSITNGTAQVTIGNNGNTVTYTNTVKTGSVVIQKKLVDAFDTDAKFDFTAYNKTTGQALGTKTLGNGEKWTISGLEYGDVIEIEELATGTIYTTTAAGLTNGAVTVDSASESVVFTNTRKTASLTVTKALASGSNDLGESFSFEVQVNKDGKWTKVESFSLEAGEKKTISGLFVGASYRVVETKTGASYNYVGMSAGNPISGADGVEFVLDGNTSITATNASRSASLTIEKIVKGNAYDDTFTFKVEKKSGSEWKAVKTVTLGGDNGMSYIFTGLTVGDVYRVTETNLASRYTLTKIEGATSSSLTDGSAQVTIGNNGNTVTYTNTVKTGSVVIEKKLQDALDSDTKFDFTAYNKTRGESLGTKSLGNGEKWTISGLEYGDVIVIEEIASGTLYTTTATGLTNGAVTVDSATESVVFTNVRKTASLKVDKALATGSNDLGESFEFELQVNDGGTWVKVQTFTLTAGKTKQIDGLFVGASYRLIETKTGASYNYVGMSAGNPLGGADGVEFVLDGDTAITATNASRSASLTIAKVVKGNAYSDTFTFKVEKKDGSSWKAVKTVTLGGDNGMSYTFTGLTVGDVYRVTETGLSSRYTLTKIEGAASSSLTDGTAQVTIGNDGNTVTYTNTVKTGSVVIEKKLSDEFTPDAKFDFTAYNKTKDVSYGMKTLGNGEKWTIEGIEYGDVIEIEELSTGTLYTTTATGLTNGAVTVDSAAESVVFTNTRNTGSLTVKKSVDAGASLGKTFSFALEVEKDGKWTEVETFTLKADQTKTISGLYVGATYRVVETDTSDSFLFATAMGGEVSTVEAGSAVTFIAKSKNDVEFVNSLKTAKLSVTKTIAAGGEWVEGEKFTFVIERLEDGKWVEYDTAVVTYEDRTWTSEKEVRVGDKFRVTETEIGYRYEISDIVGGENVDLTAKSAEVVVPVDGANLIFVNEVKQGSLTVTKTLVDTVKPDEKFSFTLYKYNASTETYDVVTGFELGNGESKTFEGLLYGDLYKVVEQSNATLYETTYVVGEGAAVKSSEASITIANEATKVAFTNTRATAKLTVDKALVNGATDEEFTFNLEKKLGTGEWQAVETFTLTASSEPKSFNLEVETDYRITETVADGSSFKFATASGVTGGYVNGTSYYFTLKTNSDVVFENELKSAGLTVRKIAANANDNDVFGFTLYKVDGKDAVAVEAFELKANEYKTFEGLLYGDKYIVKETNPSSRFELGSIDGADSIKLDEAYGLVEINGAESMTFTNIIKTGEFTVRKTLTDNTSPDAEFTFEVYRNGTLVDTFKLSGGESKTIKSNSAYSVNFGDVFEVKEIGADNYTATVTIDGAAAGDAKLTITKDSHAVAFDNVRRKVTLTVAKAIKAGDNLFEDSFSFILEQKLGDEWKQLGEEFTLSITPDAPTAETSFELDVNGVYRVTETKTGENYVFDSVVNAAAVSGKSAGTLTLADDTTVTFINTVKTGTVSVTKSLTDGYDPDAVFAFTATNAETGDIIGTFSLGADDTWVSPQLPYGTIVKITESENNNYTVTAGGLNADGTVAVLKANTDVRFTNARKSASLTVTKNVENGAELRKEFKFVLQMKSGDEWINITSVELMAGESKIFEDLFYGVDYRVIETDTSDSFDFVKVEGGTPVAVTEGDVTGNGAAVTLDSNKTLTFTNKLKGAQLKITKDVEDRGDWLEHEVFTFDIEKKNADGTWTVVKEGVELTYNNKIFVMDAVVSDVYRIVETSENYRYYLKSVAGADSFDLDTKEATVTITPSGASVLFTNDVHEGKVVVSKVWSDKYDVSRVFTFDIYKNNGTEPIDTITLTGGESKVIESCDKYTVKYGDIIKVVETTGSDYETSVKVNGTGAAIAQMVIDKASTSVEFTNVRKTASLTVKKLIEKSENLGESFSFTLYQKDASGAWTELESFSLKVNETKTFDNLLIGVDYKVVETKTGSYNFLSASVNGSDYSVSADDKAVTLTLAGDTTVTVSNIIKKASLTVNKTVVGADYGDKFTFKIERKQSDGTWAIIEENVSISADENYTWYSQASVGDIYRVTETTTGAKWKLTNVTVNGAEADNAKIGTAYEVKIVEDGSVVGFTNTAKTGSVIITKTVADKHDPAAAFSFHAQNLTTGEDYGAKTLANGETWKIEGVEYGDKIQITETVDGSVYTTTVNGQAGNAVTLDIIAGDNKAAFVNTRKTASLTVSKKLTENGGEQLGSEFKFALEIQKSGAWQQVETFTLKAGETKTINGLFVGASYRVIETDSTAAFSFYGVTGGTTLEVDGAQLKLADSNAVEFVNDLNNATLTIRKAVEGGSAGDDTFSFKLEKKDGDKWVALDETIVLGAENSYTWSKTDALVGDVYRITEMNLGNRYELTAVAGADEDAVALDAAQAEITIGAEGETVTFVNTVKTGEILVTKTLNDVIDSGASFGFELFKVENGEEIKAASFTLANGQTWSSVEAGIVVKYGDSFVVRETCDEKTYATTITIDGTAAAAGKVFTIAADETAVEFTNTRKTTDFELTKTVSGVTEQDEYFEIHMTGVFEDSNGETITKKFIFNKTGKVDEPVEDVVYAKIGDIVKVDGVYYGVEYTIEEIGAEYYSCYINEIQTNRAVVKTDVVTKGDVSNVRKTADLTVSKALTRGTDLGDSFTFELYASIDGKWVQQGDAFVLKANESKTFEGLAIGLEYKVIETDTGANYIFGSVDADSSLISTEDEKGASFLFTGDRNVTISNIIKTDSITVRKQIVGKGGDMATAFGFELQQLVKGEWVTVEKFTLKANESKTFENLDLGETFKVIETDTGATFDFAGITVDNIGASDKINLEEQSATVVLNGAEDITFNNSPSKQKLTVEKKLSGDGYAEDDKFGFHLYKEEDGSWILKETFYLKAGETAQFDTVNGEKFKVVEFETGNYYQLTAINGADTIALENNEAVVTTDTDEKLTFTNELLTGSLTVNKYTSGLVSNNEEFDFIVTDEKGNAFTNSSLTTGQFSLNAGESITINDIPYGTVVAVTENVDGSRFLTMYKVSGDDVTYEGNTTGSIVINKGSTVVDFTNQSIETKVEIESTVLGESDQNTPPPTIIDRTSGTVITGGTGGTENVGGVSTSTYTIRTDVLGESDYAPETGDEEIPVSVIILMAVSGLMVLILSKRRRVNA